MRRDHNSILEETGDDAIVTLAEVVEVEEKTRDGVAAGYSGSNDISMQTKSFPGESIQYSAPPPTLETQVTHSMAVVAAKSAAGSGISGSSALLKTGYAFEKAAGAGLKNSLGLSLGGNATTRSHR